MSETILEPDDAEVEQLEAAPGLTTLPVMVEGTVRTQQLPAKAAGARRLTVSTTQQQKLLGRDPRRRRAVIQVYDTAGLSHGIFYGTSSNEVQPPAQFAARLALSLPGATPSASHLLEVTNIDELWVLADTAACEVSVLAEQWAD